MRRSISLVLAAIVFAATACLAQEYPARAVKIVVPFPPGGPTDVIARLIAQKLSDALGQPFVAENRAGATGTIGMAAVAKAPPDGYTLLMSSTSSYIAAYLYRSAPYDPQKDFAPIANIAVLPFYLVAHPAFPANTVAELIALAKANPGKFLFASPGAGSGGHLVMERFMAAAGIRMVHVPYKGAAPAINDLVAGQVNLAFDTISTSQPFVKAGKLKAIAIASAKRWPTIPDVPTVSESGLPGFEAYLWFGMLAPAATPPAIVAKLNAEIGRIAASREMTERIENLGGEFRPNTPQEFAEFIAADTARWVKVIQDTGARAD